MQILHEILQMILKLEKNTEEGAIVEWDKARLQSTNYHKALILTAFETWKINKIFGSPTPTMLEMSKFINPTQLLQKLPSFLF